MPLIIAVSIGEPNNKIVSFRSQLFVALSRLDYYFFKLFLSIPKTLLLFLFLLLSIFLFSPLLLPFTIFLRPLDVGTDADAVALFPPVDFGASCCWGDAATFHSTRDRGNMLSEHIFVSRRCNLT